MASCQLYHVNLLSREGLSCNALSPSHTNGHVESGIERLQWRVTVLGRMHDLMIS